MNSRTRAVSQSSPSLIQLQVKMRRWNMVILSQLKARMWPQTTRKSSPLIAKM